MRLASGDGAGSGSAAGIGDEQGSLDGIGKVEADGVADVAGGADAAGMVDATGSIEADGSADAPGTLAAGDGSGDGYAATTPRVGPGVARDTVTVNEPVTPVTKKVIGLVVVVIRFPFAS